MSSLLWHTKSLSKRHGGCFTNSGAWTVWPDRGWTNYKRPALKFRHIKEGKLEAAQPTNRTSEGLVGDVHDLNESSKNKSMVQQNLKAAEAQYTQARRCPLNSPIISPRSAEVRARLEQNSNNRPPSLITWSDVQRLSNSLRTFV